MKQHVLVSAAIAVGLLTTTGVSAQTLTTLHSFNNGNPYTVNPGGDGIYPAFGGLIFDASGALYGTTQLGGDYGQGAVFKLAPPSVPGGQWTETILYSFSGGDGADPLAGLVSDASGALYGTTEVGGNYGWGIVFKLTPPAVAGGSWTETALYTFSGGNDGGDPLSSLISDQSGTLYGTTQGGGPNGWGVVFKLTPPAVAGGQWTETVLHTFVPSGGLDGATPQSGLLLDASGALYGTTYSGGIYGAGTVYKLTPPAVAVGSWTETVLYTFNPAYVSAGDANYPVAGLISDQSGALYGTTIYGGVNNNGAVFKLTPPAVAGGSWTETVLYSFGTGAEPWSSLLLDASGALYGTTQSGGTSNSGVVFKLTPPTTAGGNWTETVLHTFTGADGATPLANLIPDASGALYGTTQAGGSNNQGTVFQLTLPATFTGIPGKANCTGQSISFMAKKYGGIAHAAESLGYSSVTALQNAVVSYCGG